MQEAADALTTFVQWMQAYMADVLRSPVQIVAHLAALIGVSLAGAAALVRTMIPLRWLAVGSNVGLLVFGLLHPSPTTAAVALLLLPINVWRALEMMRLSRRVEAAANDHEMAALWLKPYMKPKRLRAGRVLFSKGDKADHLYRLCKHDCEQFALLQMNMGREVSRRLRDADEQLFAACMGVPPSRPPSALPP